MRLLGMFLAGVVSGIGIWMIATAMFSKQRKLYQDVEWTDEFLAVMLNRLPLKGYRGRHRPRLLRMTSLKARMEAWEMKTRPRNPKEVFGGGQGKAVASEAGGRT